MGAGLCGRCSRFVCVFFDLILSILFTVCNISIKKKKKKKTLLYTQDVE